MRLQHIGAMFLSHSGLQQATISSLQRRVIEFMCQVKLKKMCVQNRSVRVGIVYSIYTVSVVCFGTRHDSFTETHLFAKRACAKNSDWDSIYKL